MRTSPASRIMLPTLPSDGPTPRFPLIATLAPVVASAVLFAVTRSPFMLLFACMGPIVGVGGFVDSKLVRRRRRRRELARFNRECDEVSARIAEAHRSERDAAIRLDPPPGAPRWTATSSVPPVRIGLGEVPSAIAMGTIPAPDPRGTARADREQDDLRRRLERLRASAEVVDGAPVRVDPGRSVALRGDRGAALAAARACVLRLAASARPTDFRVSRPESTEWDWVDDLPHAVEVRHDRLDIVSFLAGDGQAIELRIDARDQADPAPDGAVVTVDSGGIAVLHVDGSEKRLEVDLISASQARVLAALLGQAWFRDHAAPEPPSTVEFADLVAMSPIADSQHVSGSRTTTLPAVIGRGALAPLAVDLTVDGPHAIVAGTTGSGKSELLLTWMLAMAADRSPDELNLLFVDFKGGAAFGQAASLPHCVGLITDLDPEQTTRALASLSAECRHRERALAALGLSSIDHAGADRDPPFARLIVVVDEYAALLQGDLELNRLFLDLAARGRSLGIHLVLCTQSPAGVVRDGILANAGLRIGLRVMTAADSRAVIGTDDASRLPADPRGRALVSTSGQSPQLVQVARAGPNDIRAVSERWKGARAPRRPWCAPLPQRLPLPAFEHGNDGAIPLGMVDLPDQQRQELLLWHPRRMGPLMIVGGVASGRSTALGVLECSPPGWQKVVPGRELARVWDALDDVTETLESSATLESSEPLESSATRQTLLLLDDLDAIIAEAPDEYGAAIVDRLARLLRSGPSRGIAVAFSVQRVTGSMSALAALCGSRLILRLPDRQEHLLAGGEGTRFVARLPPGAGWWNGTRVQVFEPPSGRANALGSATRAMTRPEFVALVTAGSGAEGLDVVAARPDRTARMLAGVLGEGVTLRVADPDAWQADWAEAQRIRRSTVLFADCSLADLRAITRSRELPPPFGAGETSLWLRRPEEPLRRVRL